MKTHATWMLSFGLLAALVSDVARAGSVTGLTTFTAGTPAKAAEVNANFAAVKTAVDNNDSRIAALEASVAALQASVATLQGNLTAAQSTIATLQSQLAPISASNVMKLEPYLTVTATGTPRALLSGINLQIVNGAGTTSTVNGTGNLIIGYDEARNDGTYFCSKGFYLTQPACAGVGGTWAVSHKSGSHYLVVGAENNYASYGGVVVGFRNTTIADYASVSGGSGNTARNQFASVSGGTYNNASGPAASVSGGTGNTASLTYASVSGGSYNTASGNHASVSGGISNTASGDYANVSGGSSNTASGYSASVSGGAQNRASGGNTHVSGGGDGSITGGNNAGMNLSSILGGVSQTTTSVSQTIPALP